MSAISRCIPTSTWFSLTKEKLRDWDSNESEQRLVVEFTQYIDSVTRRISGAIEGIFIHDRGNPD